MIRKLLALSLLASVLTACNVTDQLGTQKIAFNSTPCGADVVVDGNAIGKTPCETRLDSTVTHTVVLKKEGYAEKQYTIATEESKPTVKFGALEKEGYYKNLVVPTEENNLKPDFLPETPEEDKFAGLSKALVAAEKRKADGKVGDCEYQYLVQESLEFYAPGMKAEVQKKDAAPAPEAK